MKSSHADDARAAVRREMAARGIDKTTFAREAGTDPATVTDFLDGSRWPRLPTLAKFDAALGWEPGTLAALGEGEDRPNVSGGDHTQPMLLDIDPSTYSDLTPAELAEAMSTAKAVFLRSVREIRAARVVER